jgi:predicted deacylase
VAGAHGTEYASIIALEKLIQELNPADISGTVIIVPLVNIASFEQKVPHVNPVDGKSMNRFYPGNPNGTQTERASWAKTKQVVEKSDLSLTKTLCTLIRCHFSRRTAKLKQFADLLEAGERKFAYSRVCEGTRFGDRFQTARTRSTVDSGSFRQSAELRYRYDSS